MAIRVALDVTPLLGQPSGVGMFVRGMLQAVVDRAEITVSGYALTFRGRSGLTGVLPEGVNHHNRLPMPAGPLMGMWARWNSPTAENWTGETDVVHGTNFVVPPARNAAELVTVHDLTAVRYPHLCLSRTLEYPKLISNSVKRGGHVHVLSNSMAAEVVDLLAVPPERVHVIAPGSPMLVDSAEATAAMGRGRAGSDEYIVAIGTVEPRKDYPGLVRAFDVMAADHPALRLVIVGADGWGSRDLTQAVEAAKFGERIVRTGWVCDAARAGLIRGAKALAYPSVYEGFGLPPLEAMQANVPVVATAAGAVPEVVRDAALLVPVGEDLALADALRTVLNDHGERDRLIEAGHKRVQNFNWTRCADEFAGLYAQLDAGRSR